MRSPTTTAMACPMRCNLSPADMARRRLSAGGLALLLAWAVAACGAGRAAAPPPKWFQNPPPSSRALYFFGDATQAPEESMARDLAVQKALHELTVYVGASIKSDFKSEERERDGESEQTVSLTVDVSGEEMTIREARVKRIEVHPGDGATFDGYAMIEWPKSEYDAVKEAQAERAGRALASYRAARAALDDAKLPKAKSDLADAERFLGPSRAPIRLSDPEIKDTTVLRGAIEALAARVLALSSERNQVCAVGVVCAKNGASAPCTAARLGVLRAAVSKSGRRVATELPGTSLLEGILATGQVTPDPSLKTAGCIVAVQLTADLLEAGDPFTFVRYGARTVVFDTDSGRILHSEEIPPTKVGHTSFDAAMNKGFDQAEKIVVEQITRALGAKK